MFQIVCICFCAVVVCFDFLCRTGIAEHTHFADLTIQPVVLSQVCTNVCRGRQLCICKFPFIGQHVTGCLVFPIDINIHFACIFITNHGNQCPFVCADVYIGKLIVDTVCTIAAAVDIFPVTQGIVFVDFQPPAFCFFFQIVIHDDLAAVFIFF